MFDAQYLLFGTNTFSPWMSRGGDNCRITLDVIKSSTGGLVVQLFEKNRETAGAGDQVGSLNITTAALGRHSLEFDGDEAVKELVRYKFITTGTGSTDYILFRMLSIVWFDDVSIPAP